MPATTAADRRRAKPTAAKFRVGADAADFGVTGEPHAFARHRYESSADPNAEEGPHGMRPRQERSRFRQRGQCQHLGGILIGQHPDIAVRASNVTFRVSSI